MNVLALDTSQIQATVCLLTDGKLRAQASGSVQVAHSEALLPLIDALLKQERLTLAELDTFAAGVGPGSFTGIRIGCATIKALAQVTRRPIIPFSSLRATVLSVLNPGCDVVALVNAYQGQVFAGWTMPNGEWREDVLSAADWRKLHFEEVRNNAQGRTIRFCGTGAKLYWAAVEEGEGTELTSVAYLNADGIARACVDQPAVSYAKLIANYLRSSQAEFKLASSLAK